MKFNKAFAVIADKSVYQIIVEKFQQSFEDILTISNEPNLYRQMGTRVCEDVIRDWDPWPGFILLYTMPVLMRYLLWAATCLL